MPSVGPLFFLHVFNVHSANSFSSLLFSLVMASLINALSTAVSPYVMPVVEKNLAPDFLVRFGEPQIEFVCARRCHDNRQV